MFVNFIYCNKAIIENKQEPRKWFDLPNMESVDIQSSSTLCRAVVDDVELASYRPTH